MKCVTNYVTDLAKGIWSLIVGLLITGKYFLSPEKTVHYPRKVVAKENTDSFRGPIELVGTAKDPATPKCISCMMCVQACPSGCISIKKQPAPKMTPEQQQEFDAAVARGENPKKPTAPKNPGEWTYDYTYCSLCACCVEACPVNSIRFSHEIYLAGTRREDFKLDLLARLQRTAKKEAEEKAAKAAEKAAAAPAPVAESTDKAPVEEASS